MEDGVTYTSTDLLEFTRRFPVEQTCIDYLFKMRWAKGFLCPKCGCNQYSFHSKRILYQCKSCQYQVSVTAGTIFHKTRTPLRKWFWAIFLMSRQKTGISAMALQKLLSIKSYQTAWTMCHKIRKAMSDRDIKYQLAGIVEIDDTYLGGSKPGKAGRGAEGKTIVSVCVENRGDRPGYASMKVIEKITSKEILSVVQEKIKEKSTIRSDGFSSYRFLKNKNYTHKPEIVKGKKAHKVLRWVHILIGNLKSTIQGTFHGIGEKHLQRFLDEYCYRFNRRYKESELFDRLLTACSRAFTITYAELTG